MKNGQSREIGSIGHRIKKEDKQKNKHNTEN
jgi:hypothetical protein